MNGEPREVWRDRVERLLKSGLSTSSFAATERINARTLAWWRWQVSLERRARPTPTAKMPKRRGRRATPKLPMGFVELITPPPTPTATPPITAALEDAIEIVVRGGLLVRVRARFDPAALRAVVDALEAR